MSEQFSLVALLRNDEVFSARFKRQIEEVKKGKETVNKAASQYSKLYQDEIVEGTKKKQKLLAEGADNGLTEAEVIADYGKFLPTVQTPILNMLYFILRESEEIDRSLYQVRDQANKKINGWEDDFSSENVNEPEEMFCLLYGNKVTLETFGKLKKLKALTQSPAIEEATLAFQKCRELCEKHGIEYDKIPSLK
jgi:hypothetical protein